MTWYIDTLGSAAKSGVDVLCKETLLGDWLETIGVWQQGDGLVAYTPHPDFWLAALWRKLMGPNVLRVTISAPPVPPPPPPTPPHFVPWVYAANVSCVFGVSVPTQMTTTHCSLVSMKIRVSDYIEPAEAVLNSGGVCLSSGQSEPAPGTGSALTPLLGHVRTEPECQALCEKQANCTIYGFGNATSGAWGRDVCYGRHDRIWQLHPMSNSYCGRRVVPEGADELPLLPAAQALRAYAHVTRSTPGTNGTTASGTARTTFALANLWRYDNMTVRLQVGLPASGDPANALAQATQYVVSSLAPGDDVALLNGKPLTIGQPGDVLPDLEGVALDRGGVVILPPRAVAFVTIPS